MGMHVVIIGNPVDGFSIYGPFKTAPDAVAWAQQEREGEEYWIAPLHPAVANDE
jgi:hypothetical protein